jgi:putative toxin-antitoxin system antitoxin component (TIGR02293 family)
MSVLNFEIEKHRSIWDEVGVPFRGSSLHLSIENGFPYDVFIQTAKIIQIDRKELAAYLSISPSTMSRRAKTGKFSTEESDKLYRILNVLVAAIDLFEDNREDAVGWFRTKTKGLGNKSPLEMTSTTAGYDNAKNIIGQLQHGLLA